MIIDEAHLISGWHRRETLEEIRFLLNGGYDSADTVALILSGRTSCGICSGRRGARQSRSAELMARLRPLCRTGGRPSTSRPT